jgi:hypothetical protein
MKETKYETIPDQYVHLINQDQYIIILEIIQDYLVQYGQVTGLENGLISFEDLKGETQRFSLDNVIRKLNGQESESLENIIHEHFFSFFNDSENQFDFNNFDQIKDILVLRIYPDGYFESVNFQDRIISRVDFEDTKTTLVFDLPDKFRPVEMAEFENWKVSLDSVFAIAQQNVNKQDIQIYKQDYENGFELFAFYSGDYSASYLIDLKNNADFVIGKYGSLVAIPTKGSGFAHPINCNDISLVIGDIHDMIIKFYDEDPGQISVNYYWYYNDKFCKFPITIEEKGFRNYHMPLELEKILKE